MVASRLHVEARLPIGGSRVTGGHRGQSQRCWPNTASWGRPSCWEGKDEGKPWTRCAPPLRLTPNPAWPYHHLGTAPVNTQQLAEAEQEFREALRLEPSAKNHYSLAACLMALKPIRRGSGRTRNRLPHGSQPESLPGRTAGSRPADHDAEVETRLAAAPFADWRRASPVSTLLFLCTDVYRLWISTNLQCGSRTRH